MWIKSRKKFAKKEKISLKQKIQKHLRSTPSLYWLKTDKTIQMQKVTLFCRNVTKKKAPAHKSHHPKFRCRTFYVVYKTIFLFMQKREDDLPPVKKQVHPIRRTCSTEPLFTKPIRHSFSDSPDNNRRNTSAAKQSDSPSLTQHSYQGTGARQ